LRSISMAMNARLRESRSSLAMTNFARRRLQAASAFSSSGPSLAEGLYAWDVIAALKARDHGLSHLQAASVSRLRWSEAAAVAARIVQRVTSHRSCQDVARGSL
jgi:hypothetical protein